MIKKISVIICILSILITGCSSKINQNNKFYLSDKFYDKGKFIKIKNEDLSNLDNENYLLFTYNNYCINSKKSKKK